MGNFYIEPHPDRSRHYILIGAGSGITPLMSIMKTILEAEPLSVVSLWYGNRNEESIIFRDQLEEWKVAYPNRLQVYHTLSRPSETWDGARGRLDKDHVYNLILDLFMRDEYRKSYFICGPNPMMEAAQAALDKHAVNPTDVHREYYSAPLPTDEELLSQQEESEDEPVYTDGEIEYELKTQKSLCRTQWQEAGANRKAGSVHSGCGN